ncbi:unnamed protein product [Caenorhabditis auriculariae]|uniref:Uncharacterized protein n=1 Tax=Caenorhabditis auriculariae TaxID=2777116 RepID=A0A8S1HQR4_9PELO|nr:unnamed protein product [Caenorhabditis auriculariae]
MKSGIPASTKAIPNKARVFRRGHEMDCYRGTSCLATLPSPHDRTTSLGAPYRRWSKWPSVGSRGAVRPPTVWSKEVRALWRHHVFPKGRTAPEILLKCPVPSVLRLRLNERKRGRQNWACQKRYEIEWDDLTRFRGISDKPSSVPTSNKDPFEKAKPPGQNSRNKLVNFHSSNPALWHGDIRVEHDLGHSFRRGDLSHSEPLSGTSVQPWRLVHCPTPPCSICPYHLWQLRSDQGDWCFSHSSSSEQKYEPLHGIWLQFGLVIRHREKVQRVLLNIGSRAQWRPLHSVMRECSQRLAKVESGQVLPADLITARRKML